MRGILFLFTFFNMYCTAVLANEITVTVDPVSPVKNESFYLSFKINTDSRNTPYISFNPGRATVIQKRQTGVKISTTIINGKISTKREVGFQYELVAERAGQITFRNITVDIDGDILKHKNIRVNVLNAARQAKNMLIVAVPSKTEIFLGEGIDVNYYLLYRVSVAQNEIRKFPKLKGFIKRFHKIREREETVEYQGKIYRRAKKYSARLYPEKIGKLKIDSLKLDVQYSSGRSQNPYGVFGLSLRSYKKKTLISKSISINVLPVPTENLPPNFTGLVGKHDFKLSKSRNKFLVNEAIEVRLDVTGPGALENFEGPKIYEHDSLEEFDTKSQLSELSSSNSKKTFDYTYLPRGALNIPQKDLNLSYFNPESREFETVTLNVAELIVGGGAIPATTSDVENTKTDSSVRKDKPKRNLDTKSYELVAPEFNWEKGRNFSWLLRVLELFFIALIVLLLLDWVIRNLFKSKKNIAEAVYKSILDTGLSYSSVYKILNLLPSSTRDMTPDEMVDTSVLSVEAKSYFTGIVEKLAANSFGGSTRLKKVQLDKNHFKELLKVIGYGNSKQSK